MSEWPYNFSVENPLSDPRGPELAWVTVDVPQGVMNDLDEVSLFDQGSGQELAVGVLEGDSSVYADGSLARVNLHFRDSWDAGETKDYQAIFGRRTQVTGGLMGASLSGEFVVVNDGARQYQVHMDDSVFTQAQGLYYLYILDGELRAHGSTLTRVGGNQLDPDQASFQMWWGRHSSVYLQRSPLAVRVTLSYDEPEIVHWGPGGATVQQIVRYPDLISAEIVLTFYKGIPRIDVHSRKTVNERFWNHNGFVMEFTAILGDGTDWRGEFETVYGTSMHHVMTTTTQGPTWTRQSTTWQGIDVASDAAPAFYDLDDDGDLDMVLGSEDQGLKVFENVGDATSAQMVENASWATGLPNVTSATPTMGDLDGDGDAELLIGQAEGYLKLYRNDGGAGGPPNWTRWWGNFDRLGLDHHTAPDLGDADGDGDLDIVVGLGNGQLKGIVNTGTPTSHMWSMDDTWVQHLSQGLTKAPCDGYSVPYMVDVDYDGDTDLLLGSDDGKVIVMENVGSGRVVRWNRLDVSHHAGVVTGSPWESNSTPVMVDIDADGDRDLLIGTHRGTVYHYSFDGNTTPAKGHNNLQPLLNGSYRHSRDKDGNDGPFAVEGYGHEWYGYYVLANPRNGYAAMRYIPDWDRLAYKQEYWGDEFKFGGGNVSYYPYEPVAREYVTRAQITSNAMSNGVSAGTFISQTGTSAGFVMQPMTAMTYESDEIMLLDLQRESDPSAYDPHAEALGTPLRVLRPVNLRVGSMWTSLPRGGDGEPNTVFVEVVNQGSEAARNVSVMVEVRESHDEEVLYSFTMGPEDIPALGSFTFQAPLDTWSLAGWLDIVARVDPHDVVEEELEGDDNVQYIPLPVMAYSLPWSGPIALTSNVNSSLDADAVVRSDGRLYVAWETCQGYENIDIEGRSYDVLGGTLGPIDRIVSGSHYAVEPDLAEDEDGVVHLAYASNIGALEYYHQTANAKYYWGEKFDLWVAEWDQGLWRQPQRWTDAVDFDHSDQAPAIVPVGGELNVFLRNTYFEFYTAGNQMNSIPYQLMDVRMVRAGQGTHEPNITMSVTAGSQAWWGGPDAAPWGDDRAWVVYSSEVGNNQWDVYAEAMGTTSSIGLVRLTNSNGADEVRPAIAGGGPDPEFVVAYETTRGGDRDIAVRARSPNPNPSLGWGSETILTTDPASDMKPTVAYDGHGNYWVAWESTLSGNKDIFISRFDGTDWHGPYQVTTDEGSDEDPVLACDQGTGRVYLVWETDRNGMGNKDIYVRHMLPAPPVLTLEDPGNGDEDSPIAFEGQVEDPNDDLHHVLWDWGDGSRSMTRGPEAMHPYNKTGEYTVVARAVDRFGLGSDPVSVDVVIGNVAPVADLFGDLEVAEDAVASFTAAGSTDTVSDLPSLTVEWDFGDGTSAGPLSLEDGGNMTHMYTSSGVYNVSVTVTDDDDANDTRFIKVRVLNLPPTAEAWARFEDLDEDEPGDFSGTASDTPSDAARGLSYIWEWGDGTSSEASGEPLASHSYAASGTYQAILHAIDDDGDGGSAVVNVTVGNVAPTLEVTGPTVVKEDEEVTLTATAEDTTHDLELLEYLWDWGDGTVLGWSATTVATHTYTRSGSFQVTVRVRDDDGEEDSFALPMGVDNIRPTAKATASKTTVVEGETVHFSATGSTDTPSDLEDLSYSWDLGSELVEVDEFDHVFRSPGLYTITLTVTDDDGETSRATLDVVVTNRRPVAEGWVGPMEVRAGRMLSFDASNSTDDPWDVGGLKYSWDMSDGTVYRTATGSHIYLYPGAYNVRLTVTDGDGDSHDWVVLVTVRPASDDDDGDGGGLSAAATGGIIALVVLVVVIVAALLVLRSRGGAEEATEADIEDVAPPAVEPPGAGEASPGPEADGPPGDDGELVVEEVEVVRPREGETDPAGLIDGIERDLDLEDDGE